MVHLLGLENGVHNGDCNLLISQGITAGSAGVQGSHVGQVSVSCFRNRIIQNIPSLAHFPGNCWQLWGSSSDPHGQNRFWRDQKVLAAGFGKWLHMQLAETLFFICLGSER